MNWPKIRRTARKTWDFIWNDDSWLSWLVNIVLAFVLIKFVVYPVLGLVLGTTHPIVAVVSGSMEHDGTYDDWWQDEAYCGKTICTQGEFYNSIGITKEEFKDFRFHNGFNKGDIMVLYKPDAAKVKVGDTIVFQGDRPDPIIHRVIMTRESDGKQVFTTKGDHNQGSFYFEGNVTENRYIGKAVLRIPLLGYIKIGFVNLIQLVTGG